MNKYLAILIVLTSLLTTKTASSPSDGLSPQDEVLNPKQNSNEGTNKPTFSGPRDLICDAYGKCTHKIANVLAKTREKATKTVRRVSDKARELAGDAADIVRDGASKDFDVIDSPKRMGEDIAGNATDEIAEHVSENAKGTVKNIQGIGQVGERSLEKFLFKLKNIVGGDKMDANSVGGLIHMVGFSTAYGMCVWVTFVSSYILGRCLPREMFGMVQRRMYRVYFKAMGYCVFAAFLGHLVSRKGEVLSSKMGVFQSLCLVSALLMVMSNVIFLEPKATKAMYERMKLEKEEGRGVGFVVAAKDGMMDGMMDGGNSKVVKATSVAKERRGVVVAPKDGMMDGMMDGGSAKVEKRRGVVVAAKDGMMDGMMDGAAKDGMKDGMMDGGSAKVVKATSVAEERRDVWRLNEKLKRLNAYSSALNLSTLVVLTWHIAYMGQLLQAAR